MRSLKSGLDDRHITERWPPGREQLDNFLSNVLPASEENEYVEEVRQWYREVFKSEFKPRTRNLSVKLPYCHAKQGQYAGDRIEFVIVKDHKNRTDNLAAKEIPKGLYNVHLLRYFIEAEWKLPRPDVIISVTGGAQAFDLASVHKDMIMKGMMENTRDMQPLFITGGTNSGIMRFEREARAKYNPCVCVRERECVADPPPQVRGRGSCQIQPVCVTERECVADPPPQVRGRGSCQIQPDGATHRHHAYGAHQWHPHPPRTLARLALRRRRALLVSAARHRD